MSRRTIYASAMLALSLATLVATLPAQESLGDAARRIRSKKGDESPSPTSKTTATAPQPAVPAAVNADLNATITVSSERDEAAYSTRVRTQLEQENFKV